jgi:trk system potassium uptake protein TrkA
MLSCFAAKKIGARHTVARVRNSEYNTASWGFMKQQLEISMAVNPEKLAAEAIYDILKLPSATKVESFTARSFEMIEIIVKKGSAIDGMTLVDLRKKFSEKFLVCVVQRENDVFIPNGTFKVLSGDKIGVMVTNDDAHSILKKFGYPAKEAKNIMLIGASKTALYLADMLIKGRSSVKIIEKDPEVCDIVCERLSSKASVVCGDGMSREILLEEGVDGLDALVALTDRDEENILISFYALSKQVQKVIAKVNRNELSSISENLGLETTFSPKNIVADILVRYARAIGNSIGSKVETLYSLFGGNAEALEFNVEQDFEFAGVPIKKLETKPGILVAGITRGDEALIPGGDDCILSGDKVIVVAKGERLCNLSDILKR